MIKDPNTVIFNGRFIKIIPLSEEKFIICFNEDFSSKYIKSSAKIRCSLAQVQNNEIIIHSTIYISDPIDISLNENYIKKNSFDRVKINDKEIILSYYIHEAKEIYKSGLRRTTYYDFFFI